MIKKLGIGVAVIIIIFLGYICIAWFSYLGYIPKLCSNTDKLDVRYFTDYSDNSINLKLFYIVNITDPNPINIIDVCLPNSNRNCKKATPEWLGGELTFWQIIGLQPVDRMKEKCNYNSTGDCANITLQLDDFVSRHMHDHKIAKNYQIEGLAVVLCDTEEILEGEGHIVNYFEGGLSLARFI